MSNERNHSYSEQIQMDERDFRIYVAMLSNLKSFIVDAHKKAKGTSAPTFEVGYHITLMKTQKELDIELLESIATELVETENLQDARTASKLCDIIERMKGNK